jgi:hypothetical protein
VARYRRVASPYKAGGTPARGICRKAEEQPLRLARPSDGRRPAARRYSPHPPHVKKPPASPTFAIQRRTLHLMYLAASGRRPARRERVTPGGTAGQPGFGPGRYTCRRRGRGGIGCRPSPRRSRGPRVTRRRAWPPRWYRGRRPRPGRERPGRRWRAGRCGACPLQQRAAPRPRHPYSLIYVNWGCRRDDRRVSGPLRGAGTDEEQVSASPFGPGNTDISRGGPMAGSAAGSIPESPPVTRARDRARVLLLLVTIADPALAALAWAGFPGSVALAFRPLSIGPGDGPGAGAPSSPYGRSRPPAP